MRLEYQVSEDSISQAALRVQYTCFLNLRTTTTICSLPQLFLSFLISVENRSKTCISTVPSTTIPSCMQLKRPPRRPGPAGPSFSWWFIFVRTSFTDHQQQACPMQEDELQNTGQLPLFHFPAFWPHLSPVSSSQPLYPWLRGFIPQILYSSSSGSLYFLLYVLFFLSRCTVLCATDAI